MAAKDFLFTETRREDTAATGGPAAENRPAERSNGNTATARLDEADNVIGYLQAWLGQCTPQEFVDWRLSVKSPGFEAGDRDSLIAACSRAMDAGWKWRGEHSRRPLAVSLATQLLDGCGSGAASPEIGSVPNTAAETDGTVDDRKTK